MVLGISQRAAGTSVPATEGFSASFARILRLARSCRDARRRPRALIACCAQSDCVRCRGADTSRDGLAALRQPARARRQPGPGSHALCQRKQRDRTRHQQGREQASASVAGGTGLELGPPTARAREVRGSPCGNRPERRSASVIGDCQRRWRACCMWCRTPTSCTDRSLFEYRLEPATAPGLGSRWMSRNVGTSIGCPEQVPP